MTDTETPATTTELLTVDHSRYQYKMLGIPVAGATGVFTFLAVELINQPHYNIRTHDYANGRHGYLNRLWGGQNYIALLKEDFPTAVEFVTSIPREELHRLRRPYRQGHYWDNRNPDDANWVDGSAHHLTTGLPENLGHRDDAVHDKFYQHWRLITETVGNAQHQIGAINTGLLHTMRNIRLPVDPRKPNVDWMVPYFVGYQWGLIVASASYTNAADANKRRTITRSSFMGFFKFAELQTEPLLETDVEALFNREKFLTYDYVNDALEYRTDFDLPDNRVEWANEMCFTHPIASQGRTESPIWE